MNTCSPMFKKADAGASASRTEQNSYAPPGQMTTAGRRSAESDCISSLGPCRIAVSVAFWEIWMVSRIMAVVPFWIWFWSAASAESRARRLFYRKNFRCSDSRSGLQMAMTINISPSTTPATIG